MLKNGLYNIVGATIRIALALITTPLLIHLIGIEEYGLWTLVSTVVGVVGLTEGGLSVSTTVFLSRDIAKNDTEGISQTLSITATAIFLLGSLTALILWIGSSVIINFFPNLQLFQRSVAVSALQLGGLVLWARLLQQILVGVEQAYQKYKLINFLNTLQVGMSSLGMIVVTWWGGKTLALMQWQGVISIVMLVIHLWTVMLLLKEAKPKFIWCANKGSEIAQYSFSTWLTSIGSALFQQGDRLIVAGILGTKFLGVYGAIISITMQINIVSATAVQPLLPRLNNLLEGSRTDLEKQIKLAFQANIALALGLGGILLVLTPIIMNFLFGEAATNEYALAFRVATIIYSLYSLNAVGYYLLLGLGAANVSMIINLIAGILSLIFMFLGAKIWNLQGVIIGNLGYLITLLFMLLAMKRLNIPASKWMSWLQPAEILLLPISILSKFI